MIKKLFNKISKAIKDANRQSEIRHQLRRTLATASVQETNDAIDYVMQRNPALARKAKTDGSAHDELQTEVVMRLMKQNGSLGRIPKPTP